MPHKLVPDHIGLDAVFSPSPPTKSKQRRVQGVVDSFEVCTVGEHVFDRFRAPAVHCPVQRR